MLALACRWLMWIAVRLVPPSARVEWTGEHLGGLWQWTLEAAARGTPDSRFALGEHAKRAFRAACRARFRREQFCAVPAQYPRSGSLRDGGFSGNLAK